MVGCNPGCDSCKSCRKREKPGSSVMREHPHLFSSDMMSHIHRASSLGRYKPLMRKETFLHRMSYNPRPFEDQTRDHSALLAVMLHRLSNMSPQDARYGVYQQQINTVQQQLNELKEKHAAMMQGREGLISYVTQNAGNLVPADAIGPILTGDWSSFRRYTPPAILSPQSAPSPPVSIGVPSSDSGIPTTTMPVGPIGSLENTPNVSVSEASSTPPAPPAPPPSEASSVPAPAPGAAGAPLAGSATSSESEYQYDINSNSSERPGREMPSQEEDDKVLYGLLAGRSGLSEAEKAELKRIKRTYPPNSDVFAGEPEYEPSVSEEAERSESEAEEPEYEPSEISSRQSYGFIPSESEAEEEGEYEPSEVSSRRSYRFIPSESEAETEGSYIPRAARMRTSGLVPQSATPSIAPSASGSEAGPSIKLRGPRGAGADKAEVFRFMEAHGIETNPNRTPRKKQTIANMRSRVEAAGFSKNELADWILRNRER